MRNTLSCFCSSMLICINCVAHTQDTVRFSKPYVSTIRAISVVTKKESGGQLPRQNTDRSQKKDQEWTRGNLALKVSYPFPSRSIIQKLISFKEVLPTREACSSNSWPQTGHAMGVAGRVGNSVLESDTWS